LTAARAAFTPPTTRSSRSCRPIPDTSGHRRDGPLAGLRTGRGQQQQGSSSEVSADLARIGAKLVDDPLVLLVGGGHSMSFLQ